MGGSPKNVPIVSVYIVLMQILGLNIIFLLFFSKYIKNYKSLKGDGYMKSDRQNIVIQSIFNRTRPWNNTCQMTKTNKQNISYKLNTSTPGQTSEGLTG